MASKRRTKKKSHFEILENPIVVYSNKIPGDNGNYDWEVRFDNTGSAEFLHEPGYIGITQFDEFRKFKERVLLSPKQMLELVKFNKQSRRTI